MKNLFSIKNLSNAILVLVIFSGTTAFSQKKTTDALPAGSVKLEYNYPSDKSFKYHTDSKIVQDMDINGQSMLVNIAVYLGCEVKSAGTSNDKLRLEIKVDSMSQFVDSPQGSAGGSVNELKGKTFHVLISTAGKTEDLSEADSIVFNVEGSGETTLGQSFLNYFPVLPLNPVSAGDTWVTSDTVKTKTKTMSLEMPVKSEFKFEGVEIIDGLDCAKISATLSGSRKMITESQGMNILMNGTYTGTLNLIFAYKQGYFVKETVSTKLTGTIDVVDQNMSFPVVMDATSVNEIVK